MRLNDLDYHVEVDGRGPPLVLLHGFTGSVRSWDEVRPALAEFSRVISIDLIGHGRSAAPDDPQRYSLEASTRDLCSLLECLKLDAVDVLGYSMGGRVALHFAVHRPERVRKLILESASPGLEDDNERQKRVASDAALADRIVRSGIPDFVAEWERVPLLVPAAHVTDEARARQTALRLQNRPLGLANSLRGMGAGQQTPLWSQLLELKKPVLLIVGEQDTRYRHIAERMLPLLPAGEVAVVPNAGHTVHVDQPPAFMRLIRSALTTN
jgi:2-succinyl-6-hydroxy-2,4-cyclohexadiene-1-carboxylate synthase